MTVNDLLDYEEICRDYVESLRTMYEYMSTCNVKGLNKIMDELEAIEASLSVLLSSLKKMGLYDDSYNLNILEFKSLYPQALAQVDNIVNSLREARELSRSMDILRQEINHFFSVPIDPVTYDNVRNR